MYNIMLSDLVINVDLLQLVVNGKFVDLDNNLIVIILELDLDYEFFDGDQCIKYYCGV